MRRHSYEWNPRPPTFRERIVAGFWLAAFLFVQASYFLGWRVLGDYDKQGLVVLTLIGLVLIVRVFPTAKRT